MLYRKRVAKVIIGNQRRSIVQLVAELAAKERECERLRNLYRVCRSVRPGIQWSDFDAETEANIKAAAGEEGKHEDSK